MTKRVGTSGTSSSQRRGFPTLDDRRAPSRQSKAADRSSSPRGVALPAVPASVPYLAERPPRPLSDVDTKLEATIALQSEVEKRYMRWQPRVVQNDRRATAWQRRVDKLHRDIAEATNRITDLGENLGQLALKVAMMEFQDVEIAPMSTRNTKGGSRKGKREPQVEKERQAELERHVECEKAAREKQRSHLLELLRMVFWWNPPPVKLTTPPQSPRRKRSRGRGGEPPPQPVAPPPPINPAAAVVPCPPGLEAGLYKAGCTLRLNRLQLEDSIQRNKERIEELTRRKDNLDKMHAVVNYTVVAVERELTDLQAEIQDHEARQYEEDHAWMATNGLLPLDEEIVAVGRKSRGSPKRRKK